MADALAPLVTPDLVLEVNRRADGGLLPSAVGSGLFLFDGLGSNVGLTEPETEMPRFFNAGQLDNW